MTRNKRSTTGRFARRAAWVMAVILCAGTLGMSGCAAGARTRTAGGAGDAVAVSAALQILADREGRALAFSARAGNEIYLSADAFARAVNLPTEEITSVTLLTLPDPIDGRILLGTSVPAAGQRIAGGQLQLLRYLPNSSDPGKSGFTFLLNDEPTVIRCDLYLLSSENRAPEVALAASAATKVSTFRNVSIWGRLVARDPEGDGIRFEIVSRPVHGRVELIDATRGTYVYTPAAGYTGVDCFRYIARDRYGNDSAAVTVNLRIEKPATDVVYTDLRGNEAENAALLLTADGIMSGRQVGGHSYFDPEGTVSRADFLMMAMRTLKIDAATGAGSVSTGFSDEDALPAEKKAYVAAAVAAGYVNGCVAEGRLCFQPDRAITRAEAAVMVAAMLGTAVPTLTDSATLDDLGAVPTWARASVCTLHTLGILPSTASGADLARANEPLTRAEAARMLAAARAVG